MDNNIVGLIKDSVFKSVKSYVDKSIDEAKFDKTIQEALVMEVLANDKYKVRCYSKEYSLPVRGDATYQIGDKVSVVIPQNNYSKAYIDAGGGGMLSDPLTISQLKVTKDATFEGMSTFLNDIIVSTSGKNTNVDFILNADSGCYSMIQLASNNILRWYIANTAGNDLNFCRRNSDGSWAENTLMFDFDTGIGNFAQTPTVNGNKIWHTGNLTPSYYDHRVYNSHGNYLGGGYNSGGTEKPNWFGHGKLKLQMLHGSNNLNAGWGWCDVLWMSSYGGGDVKASNALVFDKHNDRIGFCRQNYDSTSWGTFREIWHRGNFNPASYLPKAGGTMTGSLYLASGVWIRSKGVSGWYCQDYGGGWHMTDTSWIRAYANKGIYTEGKGAFGGNLYCGTFVANDILNINNVSQSYTAVLDKAEYSQVTFHPNSDGKGNLGSGNYTWDQCVRRSASSGSMRTRKELIRLFDTETAYDIVKETQVYSFRFKAENMKESEIEELRNTLGREPTEEELNPVHTNYYNLGVMADQAPLEILNTYTTDDTHINVDNSIFLTMAALKEAMKKIEILERKVEVLEYGVA